MPKVSAKNPVIEGRASVDPRPKACEYCQVVSVCRISDEGADAVERNVDE